jgi:hypothetical protein
VPVVLGDEGRALECRCGGRGALMAWGLECMGGVRGGGGGGQLVDGRRGTSPPLYQSGGGLVQIQYMVVGGVVQIQHMVVRPPTCTTDARAAAAPRHARGALSVQARPAACVCDGRSL